MHNCTFPNCYFGLFVSNILIMSDNEFLLGYFAKIHTFFDNIPLERNFYLYTYVSNVKNRLFICRFRICQTDL